MIVHPSYKAPFSGLLSLWAGGMVVKFDVRGIVEQAGDRASKFIGTWPRDGWVREGIGRASATASKLKSRAGRGSFQATEAEELQSLERSLVGIIGSVRQVSNRRTRIIAGVIFSKLGAVASIGGITGLVSTFGAASTGSAIASLSGAAATSATLYWIGSIIGLGAVAGGVMVTTAGLGIAVVGAVYAGRSFFGRARRDEDLFDYERALIYAAMTLLKAIQEQIKAGKAPTEWEMKEFSKHGLVPLILQIEGNWTTIADPGTAGADARPLSETLSLVHRDRLQASKKRLAAITTMYLGDGI